MALAHPLWSQLTEADGLAVEAAHAVEIYNHKAQIETDRGDGIYLWDALLHAGRRVSAIASDDSHWHNADAFAGWIMVKAEENTPQALIAALKCGAFYASQGPEIHAIARDGDAIEVACSPASSIILAGDMTWRERVVGAGLTRARLPLASERGGWRRLIVRTPWVAGRGRIRSGSTGLTRPAATKAKRGSGLGRTAQPAFFFADFGA